MKLYNNYDHNVIQQSQVEVMMKKMCVLTITAVFMLGIAVSPVFAAGGKNHGTVGQGATDQGRTADAPGYNAQENMVNPPTE